MRCLHTRYWVLECVEGTSALLSSTLCAEDEIVARYSRHPRFQRRQRTFSALGREVFRSGREENSSYWQWLERDSDHPWPCSRKHAFGYLHQRSNLDCAAFRWRGSWSVDTLPMLDHLLKFWCCQSREIRLAGIVRRHQLCCHWC